MKVYVVTNYYENDGEYEDFHNGYSFHCVCSTFDKAVEEIEKIIKEREGKRDQNILPEDERECIKLANGKVRWTIGTVYTDDNYYVYKEEFYVTEMDLI